MAVGRASLVGAIFFLRRTPQGFGHCVLGLVFRSQNMFCFIPGNDQSVFGDSTVFRLG